VNKKTNTGIGVLLTAILLSAWPLPIHAEDPVPVRWTLTASAADLPLRKGSLVKAVLHASILPGWHLYALEQQPGGPTPTKISVPDHAAFIVSGPIGAQAMPEVVNDPNFNLETRYFEDRAGFSIPLKAVSAVPSQQPKLAVEVLFQTCNDRMCLPPRLVSVSGHIVRTR
jgi:hypothetical protein